MDDNTPLYVIMFDMQMNLCERFPAMTPLTLRREKAREVFLLISRLNTHSEYNKQPNESPTPTPTVKNGQKVIRKPAGDNWF